MSVTEPVELHGIAGCTGCEIPVPIANAVAELLAQANELQQRVDYLQETARGTLKAYSYAMTGNDARFSYDPASRRVEFTS